MSLPRGSSLSPGFRHVESFSDDNDYVRGEDGSVEEEISYVTLDLGAVEPTLLPSSSTYRLIGLDTPTPYLQLSGTVFRGEHRRLLGTEIIFCEDKDESDPSRKHVSHLANTEQRIRFKEVELCQKASSNDDEHAKLQEVDRQGDTGLQRNEKPKGRGRGRRKESSIATNDLGQPVLADPRWEASPMDT